MIGIIAAMDEEVQELLNLMENTNEKELSHVKFITGTLENKEAVLMRSGVGKVNAAMSTTIMFEHFNIDYVINIGTAGGVKQNEEVLDIVVSNRVVQHDFDTSGLDGEEGIGMYFQSDDQLRAICEKVLITLNKRFHVGMIATGDQFVHNNLQLSRITSLFPEAICAEMEAGAIAQVCTSYKTPFIVLRSLSDIAHKEGSHMDFETYVTHASKASALICKEIVSYI